MTPSRTLGRLRSWRLWAVAVVVAAAVAGGYYGIAAWTDSSAEEEAAQTQLVPVTRGDLVNDVSVTGTLTYATREVVSFAQQGFVSSISVSEGDDVSAGDVLARMDEDTVANLEKAIAQARIDVRDAEEALEEARSPYTAAQIAQAESDAANARLSLQEAEEELSELGVVSPETLAQARIDILQAGSDLDEARERRATLLSATVQDIAKAQADVTAARIALRDAKDDLDAFLSEIAAGPDQLELDSKNRAVESAEADVLDAEAALEALTEPDESDVELADREIELAKARLAEVEEALADLLEEPDPVETQVRQTAVRLAEESLAEAEATLEEYGTVDELEVELRQADLVAARTALDVAISNLDRSTLRAPFDGAVDGVYVEDDQQVSATTAILRIAGVSEEFLRFGVPGTVGDVLVVAGESVSAGDALAVMDADTVANLEKAIAQARIDVRDAEEALEEAKSPYTAAQVAQAESDAANARLSLQQAEEELSELGVVSPETLAQARIDILQARSDLDEAREKRATLLSPTFQDVAQARADVTAARIALRDAKDDLDAFLSEIAAGPDQLELESKNRAVGSAEAGVLDAEAALAALTEPDESDVELADREIELAEARVAEAEEALAELLEEPDPVDVEVKQTAVRLAKESLGEAEATLEEYGTADELEVELRQAGLVAARTALDVAISNLERSTLRAPFDGVVVAVYIEEGEQVNSNTQAVEIADPSIVEVSGSVDEIDVLFLREGAEAFVSLEALGSQLLPGTVTSIAGTGTSQQGVVTYPVRIRLDTSESGQLPEGLSATAQVIIREETDAILVPLQALYGSVQAPTVRAVAGSDIVERQVTLGISDDFWVVVEEGLDEGETIVMEVVGSSTSQFGGIGATFRVVGGGFRPPGAGGGGGGNRP